jgi:hypothetical protein
VYSTSPRTSANLTSFGDVNATLIPVDETGFEDNGSFGRDSLIHGLTVTKSLALGYKSLAQMVSGAKVVAVGRSAAEMGLWHENDVFMGAGVAYRAVATTKNVVIGTDAATNASSMARMVVIGDEALLNAHDVTDDAANELTAPNDYKMLDSVAIGQRVGASLHTVTDSILIGPKAGDGVGSAETSTADRLLVIGNQNLNAGVPIMVGSLSGGKIGVNVFHDGLDGTKDNFGLSAHMTIVEGVVTVKPNAPNTNGNGLLVHREGASGGITISTTGGYTGNLFFADGDSNSIAAVQYNHTLDEMYLKAGGGTRFTVRGNGRINCANLPTSAAGLVSGDLWRNGTAVNIVA